MQAAFKVVLSPSIATQTSHGGVWGQSPRWWWAVIWASCIFHAVRETDSETQSTVHTFLIRVTAETISEWKLYIHMGFKMSCETASWACGQGDCCTKETEQAWNEGSYYEAMCLSGVFFLIICHQFLCSLVCSSQFSIGTTNNPNKVGWNNLMQIKHKVIIFSSD